MRENHGKFWRFFRALNLLQPADLVLEHLFVEKKQRAQRLILGGSRDVAMARQMSKELRYLLFRHFGRMAFVVVNNEPLDPVDVCLLRANAVMLSPNYVAHLIE